MRLPEQRPKRAILFAYVWPEPYSSAAGLRTLQVLRTLRKMECDVTVASSAGNEPARELLEKQGYKTRILELNASSADDWIRETSPGLCIFDRFVTEEQWGWKVLGLAPGAMRVIDTQDLHFLREQRQSEATNMTSKRRDLFEREMAAILRSDLSLLVSHQEEEMLLNRWNVSPERLQTIRYGYPKIESGPPFEERSHFCFLGNYRHAPNLDGILWLIEKIWPKIHAELPAVELHLLGAYPQRQVTDRLKNTEGARLIGPVPDARKALSHYRVNLAPLRFGAGWKGKITDGWSVGTPIVSTAVGAEGLTENDSAFGGEVADSIGQFTKYCVELYKDMERWSLASKAGIQVLESRFSEAAEDQKLRDALITRWSELEESRDRNWMGKVLLHHQFQSTKYFSKWIEEKNKSAP